MPPRINFQRDQNLKQATPGDNSQRYPQLLATDSSGFKETSGLSGTPVAKSDFATSYDNQISNQRALSPIRPAPTEEEGFGRSSNQLSNKSPVMSDFRPNSGVPSLASFDGRYDLSDQPYPAVIPVDDVSSPIGIAPSLQHSSQSRTEQHASRHDSVITGHARSLTGRRTESEATDTSGNNSPISSKHAAKYEDTVRDPRLTRETTETLIPTPPAFALPIASGSLFDLERKKSGNSHENVQNTTFNRDSFQSEVITHQSSQFLDSPASIIPVPLPGKFLDTPPANPTHANPSVQLSVPFANSQSNSFQYTHSVTYNNDNDNDEVDDIHESASELTKQSQIPSAIPRYARRDNNYSSSNTITQSSTTKSSIPIPSIRPKAHNLTDQASSQLKTNLPAFNWKTKGIGLAQHNVPPGIEVSRSSVESDNDVNSSRPSSSLAPALGLSFATSRSETHEENTQSSFKGTTSTNFKHPDEHGADTQFDQFSRSQVDHSCSNDVSSSSAFGTSHTTNFHSSSTFQTNERSGGSSMPDPSLQPQFSTRDYLSDGKTRFEDTQVRGKLSTSHRNTNVTEPVFAKKSEDINSAAKSQGIHEINQHHPPSSLSRNRFGFSSTPQRSSPAHAKDSPSSYRPDIKFTGPAKIFDGSAVRDSVEETKGSDASDLLSSNEDHTASPAPYLSRSETKLDTSVGRPHDLRYISNDQTCETRDDSSNFTSNSHSVQIQEEKTPTVFQEESIALSNQEAHYRNKYATDEVTARQQAKTASPITKSSVVENTTAQSYQYQSSQAQSQTNKLYTTTNSTSEDLFTQRFPQPLDFDDEDLEYLEEDKSDFELPSEHLKQTSFNAAETSKATFKSLPAVPSPGVEPSYNFSTGRAPDRAVNNPFVPDLTAGKTSNEWVESKEVHKNEADLETGSNQAGADFSARCKANEKFSIHQSSPKASALLFNKSEEVYNEADLETGSNQAGADFSAHCKANEKLSIHQSSPKASALLFNKSEEVYKNEADLETGSNQAGADFSTSCKADEKFSIHESSPKASAFLFNKPAEELNDIGHGEMQTRQEFGGMSSSSTVFGLGKALRAGTDQPTPIIDTLPMIKPAATPPEAISCLEAGSFNKSSIVYDPVKSVNQDVAPSAFTFGRSTELDKQSASEHHFEVKAESESGSSCPSSRASDHCKFDQPFEKATFNRPDRSVAQDTTSASLIVESSNTQTQNFGNVKVKSDSGSSSSSSRVSRISKDDASAESPAVSKPERSVGQDSSAVAYAFESEHTSNFKADQTSDVKDGSESDSSSSSSSASHRSKFDQTLDKPTYQPESLPRQDSSKVAFTSENLIKQAKDFEKEEVQSDSSSSSSRGSDFSKHDQSFEPPTAYKSERLVDQSTAAATFTFDPSIEQTENFEREQSFIVKPGSESGSSSSSSRSSHHSACQDSAAAFTLESSLKQTKTLEKVEIGSSSSAAFALKPSIERTEKFESDRSFEVKVGSESRSSSPSSKSSHQSGLDQALDRSTSFKPDRNSVTAAFTSEFSMQQTKVSEEVEVKSDSSSSSSKSSHISRLDESLKSPAIYNHKKLDSRSSNAAALAFEPSIEQTENFKSEQSFIVKAGSDSGSSSPIYRASHHSELDQALEKSTFYKPDDLARYDNASAALTSESSMKQTKNFQKVEVESDSSSSSSKVSHISKLNESFEYPTVNKPERLIGQSSVTAAFAFEPSNERSKNVYGKGSIEVKAGSESGSSSSTSKSSQHSELGENLQSPTVYEASKLVSQNNAAEPFASETLIKHTEDFGVAHGFEHKESETKSLSSSSNSSHCSNLSEQHSSDSRMKSSDRQKSDHYLQDAVSSCKISTESITESQSGGVGFKSVGNSKAYQIDDVNKNSFSQTRPSGTTQRARLQESLLLKSPSRPLSMRSTSSNSSSAAQERKIEVEVDSKHTERFNSRETTERQEDACYPQSTATNQAAESTWTSCEIEKDISLSSQTEDFSGVDSQVSMKDRPVEMYGPSSSLHFSNYMEDTSKRLSHGVSPGKAEHAEDNFVSEYRTISSRDAVGEHETEYQKPYRSSERGNSGRQSVASSLEYQDDAENTKTTRKSPVLVDEQSKNSLVSNLSSEHQANQSLDYAFDNRTSSPRAQETLLATSEEAAKFSTHTNSEISHSSKGLNTGPSTGSLFNEKAELAANAQISTLSRRQSNSPVPSLLGTTEFGREDSHLRSTPLTDATPAAPQNTTLPDSDSQIAEGTSSSNTDEINSSSGSSSKGRGTNQTPLPFVQVGTTDSFAKEYSDLSSLHSHRLQGSQTPPLTALPMVLDAPSNELEFESQTHQIYSTEKTEGVDDQATTERFGKYDEATPISATSDSTSNSPSEGVADQISAKKYAQNVKAPLFGHQGTHTAEEEESLVISDSVASDYSQHLSAALDDGPSNRLHQREARLDVTDQLQNEVTTNTSTLLFTQVYGSSPHQPSSAGTWDQDNLMPSPKDLTREQVISFTERAESDDSDTLKRSHMTHDSAEDRSPEIIHSEPTREHINIETSSSENINIETPSSTEHEPTKEPQFSASHNPTTHSVRQDQWSNDHTTTSRFEHSESSSQVTMDNSLSQSAAPGQETDDSHSTFTEHKLTTTTTTTRTESYRSQEIPVSEPTQDPTPKAKTTDSTRSEDHDYDNPDTSVITPVMGLEIPTPKSNSEDSEALCDDKPDEPQVQHPLTHSDISPPRHAPLSMEPNQTTSEAPAWSMSSVARQHDANVEISDNGTGSPEVSMIFKDLSEEQSALDISVELDSHLRPEANLHESTFRSDDADAALLGSQVTSQSTIQSIRTTRDTWTTHSRGESFTITHESIPEFQNEQNRSQSSSETPPTLVSPANPRVASLYEHTDHFEQGSKTSHFAGASLLSPVSVSQNETSENTGNLTSISIETRNDQDDVTQALVSGSQLESSSDMDSSSSSLSVSVALDQEMVKNLAMSPGHSSNILRDTIETAKEADLDTLQDGAAASSRSTDISEDVVAASNSASQGTNPQDQPTNNSSRAIVVEERHREAESRLGVFEDAPKEIQPTHLSSELDVYTSSISNMISKATSDEKDEPDFQPSLDPHATDAYLHVATEVLSTSHSGMTTLENDPQSHTSAANGLDGYLQRSSESIPEGAANTSSGERQEYNKTSTNEVNVSSFSETSGESHSELKPQEAAFESSLKELTSERRDFTERSPDPSIADARAPNNPFEGESLTRMSTVAELATADQTDPPLKVSEVAPVDEPSSPQVVSPDYPIDSTPTIPITEATAAFNDFTKVSELIEASPLSFPKPDPSIEHPLEAESVTVHTSKDIVEEIVTEPVTVACESSTSVASSDGIAIATYNERNIVGLEELKSTLPSDTGEGHTPLLVDSEVALKDSTADADQSDPQVPALDLISRSMSEESVDIPGAADPHTTGVTLATVTDDEPAVPVSTNVPEPPQEEPPAIELESVQTTSSLLLDANSPDASPKSLREHVTSSLFISEVIEPEELGVNHQVSPPSRSNETQSETVMNQIVTSDIQENHESTNNFDIASARLPIGCVDIPELFATKSASSEHTHEDRQILQLTSPLSPILDCEPELLESRDGMIQAKSTLESSNFTSESAVEMANCLPTPEATLNTKDDLPLENSNQFALAVEADVSSTFDLESKVLEPRDQNTQLSDQAKVALESSNVTSELVAEGNPSPPSEVTTETRNLSSQENPTKPTFPVEPAPDAEPDITLESSNKAETSIITSESIVEMEYPSLPQASEVNNAAIPSLDDSNSPVPAIKSDVTYNLGAEPRVLETSDIAHQSLGQAKATISDTVAHLSPEESTLHTLDVRFDVSPDLGPDPNLIQSQVDTVQAPDQPGVTLESSNHASNLSESFVEIDNPSLSKVSSEIEPAVSANLDAESKALETSDLTFQSSNQAEAMSKTFAVIPEVVAHTGDSSPLEVSSANRDISPPEDNSLLVAVKADVTSPLNPVPEVSESPDDIVHSLDQAESTIETFKAISESSVEIPNSTLEDSSETRALKLLASQNVTIESTNQVESTIESSKNITGSETSNLSTYEDSTPLAAVETVVLESQEETVQSSNGVEVPVESSNVTSETVVHISDSSPPAADTKDTLSPEDSPSLIVAVAADLSPDPSPEADALKSTDDTVHSSSQIEATFESSNMTSESGVQLGSLPPYPELSSEDCSAPEDLTSPVAVELAAVESQEEAVHSSEEAKVIVESLSSPPEDSTLPTVAIESAVAKSQEESLESTQDTEVIVERSNIASDNVIEVPPQVSTDDKDPSPPEASTLPTVTVESKVSPELHSEPKASESPDEHTQSSTQAQEFLSDTRDLLTPADLTSPALAVAIEETTQTSKDIISEFVAESSKGISENLAEIHPEFPAGTTNLLSPADPVLPAVAVVEDVAPDQPLQPTDDTVQLSNPTEGTLEVSEATFESVVEVDNSPPPPVVSSEDLLPLADSPSPTMAVQADVPSGLSPQCEELKSTEETVELSTQTEGPLTNSRGTSKSAVEISHPSSPEVLSDTLPPEDSTASTVPVESDVTLAINPEVEASESQDQAIVLSTQTEALLESSQDISKSGNDLETPSPAEVPTETKDLSPFEETVDLPTQIEEVSSETKDLLTPGDSASLTVAVESEVPSDVYTELEVPESQDEAVVLSTHTKAILESSDNLSKSVVNLDNPSPPKVPSEPQDVSPLEDSASPTVVTETDVLPDPAPQPEELKSTQENVELSTQTEAALKNSNDIFKSVVDSGIPSDLSETKDLPSPEDPTSPTVVVEPEISPDADTELKTGSQDETTQRSIQPGDELQGCNVVTSENLSPPEVSAQKDLSPTDDSTAHTVAAESEPLPDVKTELKTDSQDSTIQISTHTEDALENFEVVSSESSSSPEASAETKNSSPSDDSTPLTAVVDSEVSPDINAALKADPQDETIQISTQTQDTLDESKVVDSVESDLADVNELEADSAVKAIQISTQTEDIVESSEVVDPESSSPPEVSAEPKDLSPMDDSTPPAAAVESELLPDNTTELKADSQDETIQISTQTEDTLEESEVVDSEDPSPTEVPPGTAELPPTDDSTSPMAAVESEVSPDVNTELKADSQDEAIQTSTQTEDTLKSSEVVDPESSSPPEVSAEPKDLSPMDDSTPPAAAVESELLPDNTTELKADSQDETIQISTQTEDKIEQSEVVDTEDPSPTDLPPNTKDLPPTDDSTSPMVAVESEVSPDVDTELKADSQDEAIQTSIRTEDTRKSFEVVDPENPSPSEVPPETEDLSPSDDSTSPAAVVESEVSRDLGPESEALKSTEEHIQSSTHAEDTSENHTTATHGILQTEAAENVQVSSRSYLSFPTDAPGSTSPPTLFHASTTSFLRTPTPSIVSVPRPLVDPAAIARVRPAAPVVRNIRREVILPARMKKLSTVSTVSVHPPISSLLVINSLEKEIEVSEEKTTAQKNLSEKKPVVITTPKPQRIIPSKCKAETSGTRSPQISHEHVVRSDSVRKYHASSTVTSRCSGRKSHVTVEQGGMKGRSIASTSAFQSTSTLISSCRRSADVPRTNRGQPFHTITDHKRSSSVKSPNRALEILRPRPRLSHTPERKPPRTGCARGAEVSSPSTSRQLPSGPLPRPRCPIQRVDDYDIIESSDTIREPMATDPNCNPKLKHRLSTRLGSSVRGIIQKHGSRPSPSDGPRIGDLGIEEEFDIESEFQRLSAEITREQAVAAEEQSTQVATMTQAPREMRSTENDSHAHHSNGEVSSTGCEGNSEVRFAIGSRFRNKITMAAASLADKISKNPDPCDERV